MRRIDERDFLAIGSGSGPDVANAAGVGATEGDLREAAREYATRTYAHDQTTRCADGFLKTIIEPEGTILGCHIVGPEASNLIRAVVVAMTAGSETVRDVWESVHVHRALSEVVDRGVARQFSRGVEGHSQ